MNRLTLSTSAVLLLRQQLRLSGVFNHSLQAPNRATVHAQVRIEQAGEQVQATARVAGTCSTLTLDRQHARNAHTLARLLENAANGCPLAGQPDATEADLCSRVEHTLRQAVRRRVGVYVLDLDGAEVSLTLSPTHAGTRAALHLAGTVAHLPVPDDAGSAYALLRQRVQQLAHDYHTAQAA
ncbi:hypothetical protein [Metapseudomonas otitidis]|uniref:hypothetical protein n=1 Tax=Metapseudomonas otitidis TaxID=319939 RepID=UPI0013F5C9A4|nr:hypothetical protein [Pseudomonas otitidis]